MRKRIEFNDYSDRRFKLWEYSVSHRQLLVRAPRDGKHAYNIDLVFESVSYIRMPHTLDGLSLVGPDADEVLEVKSAPGGDLSDLRVFALQTDSGRYVVAATKMHAEENDFSYLESSLDLPGKGIPKEPLG